MQIKVKIEADAAIDPVLRYIWDVFARYIGFPYSFTQHDHDLIISGSENADVRISGTFTRNILERKFHFSNYFSQQPLIVCEDGTPDYLGTAFYMINCLQEYDKQDADTMGRFRYSDSFQHRYECAEEDLAGKYFSLLYRSLPVLHSRVKQKVVPARVFLSHDNDTFYGSFLQDGMYALKKGRIDILLKLVVNEAMRKPGWLNLEKIMDIEDEYDVRSTFFWLVNKGRMNADYDVNSTVVRGLVNKVKERGFENGLHKSISQDTFEEERTKLGIPVTGNRNHFLRISIPGHFSEIEKNGIPLDFSLGFAEKMGFRNCYALPFMPYNMEHERVYSMVEVPLNIMDTTFFNYEKMPVKEAGSRIISFFEKNRTNSIISVLWHNNFFSPYKFKGYLEVYKTILDYMKANDLRSVSHQEIIEEFFH